MEMFTLINVILLLLASHTNAQPHNHQNTAFAPAPSTVIPVVSSPPPASNLTTQMYKKGCKTFSALISSIPDVLSAFDSVVDGGLTVFCVTDEAIGPFLSTYKKNLTADGKSSLLLYHGVPVYYSLDMLKRSNGEFNTLATDGTTNNYNFTVQNAGDGVTVKTGVVTATVVSTVVDQDPLAVYAVDQVLKPRELFKVVEPPTPAPAPKKDTEMASPPFPSGEATAPSDRKPSEDTNGGRPMMVDVSGLIMTSVMLLMLLAVGIYN